MNIKKWRSKTIKLDRGYDPLVSVNSATEPTAKKQSVWKALWKKMKKEKRSLMVRSTSVHVHQVPYDEYTYMQNFDQGLEQNSELEPEILTRSFSARYTSRHSTMF